MGGGAEGCRNGPQAERRKERKKEAYTNGVAGNVSLVMEDSRLRWRSGVVDASSPETPCSIMIL
jgi:hypothetical protein